jgi:hypothetical protein
MFDFLRKHSKAEAERRRFERLDPEEKFLVEFRKANSGPMRLGEGRDISEGGLKFATSFPVHKGESLSLIVYFPKHFPGPRKAACDVTVRRTYEPGPTHRSRVACEFAEPQPLFQQAVMDYMRWSTLPLS